MKVLFLGEITGRCGIGVIKNGLKKYRTERKVDFVIANGEGATGGFGLGFQHAQTLFHMGVDVLTLGEKTFFKIDMVEGIAKKDRILRPANYPESVPGRGIRHFTVGDKRVCVVNMLGMMGFQNPHLNNPFLVSESIVEKAHGDTPFVFYVFHAQATAEKCAMGRLLDGKASAVVGTHTKALTADGCILHGGTAYISDTGRCGAVCGSVGGFDPENEIKKMRTQVLFRSKESWTAPQMQGFLCEFDNDTGFALSVETVRIDVAVEPLAVKEEVS
ncbi:MAG: YmdB family metallophosphoesterase [Sphaerochaetaceae bacterium]|nr:YmdB family metallophosphoesterase [Sphaerochaetaceae bacterium]